MLVSSISASWKSDNKHSVSHDDGHAANRAGSTGGSTLEFAVTRKQTQIGIDPCGSDAEIALAALKCGDARTAFAYSDRWIRTSGQSLAALLLRAEALRLSDRSDQAQVDIRAARARDPLSSTANLKAIDAETPGDAEAAARGLLLRGGADAAPALSWLARQVAIPGVALFERPKTATLRGWIAWRPNKKPTLAFLGRTVTKHPIEPDPSESRAAYFGAAAEFSCGIPEDADAAVIQIGGETIARTRLAPTTSEAEKPWPCGPDVTTIVVPVYDDPKATIECLRSAAAAATATTDVRVLIVEDASPSPILPAFLKVFGLRAHTRVVTNAHNRGYVGSVNRALALIPDGDVLLLNADTLIAPDVIDRFREIAGLDPRIGAINPLSNHGEFVSFPKPFVENPFPDDWREIHAAAGKVNGGIVVDIPATIGFCLYITRACLSTVGQLCDEFESGYLEDADYSLRVRESGFRNVCAPSIFVPHLGSRSFREEKKDLVARNRCVLQRRHPDHARESEAYLLVDSLKTSRARLERALIGSNICRLVVAGEANKGAANFRADVIKATSGADATIALILRSAEGVEIALRSRALPQNLSVPATDPDQIASLICDLRPDAIEIDASSAIPPALARALVDTPIPIHRLVTGRPLALPQIDFKGDVAVDAMGRALLLPPARRSAAKTPAPLAEGAAIGVLLPVDAPAAISLLLELAPLAEAANVQFVAIGATASDRRLIGRGIFVTGPAEIAEYPALIESHGIRRLFLPYRGSYFFALEAARGGQRIPAAYFDWSGASFCEFGEDLSLSPEISNAEVIGELQNWLSARE
jgi:O-antigen biosynthesis protein